jgi:NAD(P)-dependent dehydrogenase (short-subunit alcohol dehydrogenase family)
MATTSQLYDLNGKVALITGGSRGLGLQMAEGLGEMGARLVLAARNGEQLAGAVSHLATLGIEARSVVADLSRLDAVTSLADQAIAHFGSLDILINNAGSSWVAAAENYPDDAWLRVMNLSVNVPFALSRELARRVFIPQRSGRIINISSIAGFRGNTTGLSRGGHMVAYHTGKGALLNLTRALAVEWGSYGINVNCICPGFFQTRLSAEMLDKVAENVLAATPLHRIGGKDDLKGVAAFLASPAAQYISGQMLVVDGGFSAG